MTPDPSHLLSFNLVCCVKEVNNLISLPIVMLESDISTITGLCAPTECSNGICVFSLHHTLKGCVLTIRSEVQFTADIFGSLFG